MFLEKVRFKPTSYEKSFIGLSNLKEIADVCGIHKNLSTHTARHSYATSICLANGVSMENVAKMLGHADTNVTKHYARVLDQNILKDMQKVNNCLSELAI